MDNNVIIIQCYNGQIVVDDRIQAQDFINALDDLERKYREEKEKAVRRNKKWYMRLASAVGIL